MKELLIARQTRKRGSNGSRERFSPLALSSSSECLAWQHIELRCGVVPAAPREGRLRGMQPGSGNDLGQPYSVAGR